MIDAQKYAAQAAVFDLNKLMAEAREITGLADFGGSGFVEPMTRWLDRVARELDFNAEGLEAQRSVFVRFLVNRLRTAEDIRLHPEILEEDVSDPLIIIGLPRSGTTKLQRMMAAAPEVQKLFMWRMLNPARFPDAIPGQIDPRMVAVGIDAAVGKGNSAVQAAHAMAASLVDEEMVLFDFVLDPSVTGWNGNIPLFHIDDWVTGKDRPADREAYRYVRTLLQYLQWQDGGKRNRPWILKAIIHLPHMDALTECFPNATLVHCHRDPRDAIPSVAKLMCVIWGMKVALDKQLLGRDFVQWGSIAVARYLEARQRLRLDDRILDVKYENVRDDIMPVIRQIYQRAGWELTAEAERAMLQWEQDNEQGKHGKHVYSLEELGLGKEMIDQAFAGYIDRFIDRRRIA